MITCSVSQIPTHCHQCIDLLARHPRATGYYEQGDVKVGVCDACKGDYNGVVPLTTISKVKKYYNVVCVGWDRLMLPSESGVYFVTDGERLYYIGKTENLRDRFHSHHKMQVFLQIENRQLFFLPIIQPEVMEKKLIKQFKPIINGMSNNYVLQGV